MRRHLRLDGTPTAVPGLTGQQVAAVSAWKEDSTKLETRQKLSPSGPDLASPSADAFVTVRSLHEPDLWEEVSVLRGGVLVPGATARRVLRRK